jgi:sugar O-acyltransferase (sialic acid O-acetyltransferase NeuD family)
MGAAVENSADYVVCGSGGQAKVVIAAIEAVGGRVVRVLDDDPARHGADVLGHRVEGPIADDLIPAGVLVIVGIGTNRVREAVVGRLTCAFGTVVHPSAIVHPSVTVGEGSVIFAGAILQPGASVGRHVIVNTAASVDHDCVLEDFTHAAPGVHMAGDVRLEVGAFLGTGCCVIPGRRIGAWATVGAGGVVVRDVPADETAVGVPARPRPKL